MKGQLNGSSEILQDVSSNIPGVVYQFILRKDGSYSLPYISEGAVATFGVSPQEATNDAGVLFSLVHEDDLEELRGSIAESAENMKTWRHEFRIRTVQGELKWLSATSSPRRLGNDETLWNGVLLDITDRRRMEEDLTRAYEAVESLVKERTDDLLISNQKLEAEIRERNRVMEALRTSEEKYRLLFANTHEGIAVIQNGVVRFTNPVILNFSGYTEEELRSRPFIEFIHPDDVEMVAERHSQRLAGQPITQNYPFRVIWKNSGVRWVEAHSVPISWEGRPAILSFINDVTERLTAEEKLSHRLEMEKVVAAISTNFLNLCPDEIDQGINTALEQMGRFADVDRSYVFRFFEGGQSMSNTHEWCSEGILPQMDRLQGLDVDTFPWWTKRLSFFEDIYIPRVAELPAEAFAEKQILESQNIQSLIVVPLAYGQELTGFLGFDSVRSEKVWSEEDIALLKVVGGIIVSALQRKEFYEALLRRETELESQARSLEEVNTALRVLLKNREEDQKKTEERILSHVKNLVFPFLDKMNDLDSKQDTYLQIIKSNLADIVSPLARSLSAKYADLTPKEIEVAQFVKAGKTSKEMAELLNISPAAVNFHRHNVRKKLGLQSRTSNLRSFLLSIQY